MVTVPLVRFPVATAADTTAVAVPEPSAQAIRYHQSGTAIWAAATVLGLLLPALVLWTGISARLRTVAYRVGRRRGFGIMLYAVLLVALLSIVQLPFDYYIGYLREHAYGLSTETRAHWFRQWATGLGVGAVLAALGVPIPYLLLRRSPRRWWLYGGLAMLPLSALLLVAAPVWIDPLFNHYGPMHDQALERRIVALSRRAGIDGTRVFEVDKSRETRTVNAYVAGIGATKRVVLWDTILERLTSEQLLFVVGHESGHYVLHHTLVLVLGSALVATLALYTVHRLAGGLIAGHARRFGFDRLDDVASAPLLMLLGGIVSFVLTPPGLAVTRHLEHEADRFGLELTRDNRAAAETFVRLQQENLAVPRPGLLYTLWRGSHPSLAERIEFANRYRPWATGGRLRYARRFR